MYELWVIDDDMIMKAPHMNMSIIWDMDNVMIHVKCNCLYMRYCYLYVSPCETQWYWKWYDMILILSTIVYDCYTCLTWLKRNGNRLAVQVLAYLCIWYGIGMDLSALQDRSVSATSKIPFSLYVIGRRTKVLYRIDL